MKRVLLVLTGLFLLIAIWLPCSIPADAAEGSLFVYDGNTLKKEFSLQELKDLQGYSYYSYSGYNTYASYKKFVNYSAQGPTVQRLLSEAGIDFDDFSDDDVIKFVGSDLFSKSLTREQLLTKRYYFPYGDRGTDHGVRGDEHAYLYPSEVPVIIDLGSGSGTLRLGQIAPNEQNWPAHIQNMVDTRGGKIVIERGKASALPSNVTTSVTTDNFVLPGQEIELLGGNHFRKVYYSLDGSEPTIHSDIYNYNTFPGSEAHATITAPIIEGEVIVIKTRLIGFGYHDSAVQTFTYTVDSAAVQRIIDERTPKPEPVEEPKVVKGKTYKVKSQTYKVTRVATKTTKGTVTFTKAKNVKSVTVPATVRLADGKTYNVTAVGAKAFTGSRIRTVTIGKNVSKLTKNALYKSKATKIVLKTKKLKKAVVKGCLKGSKVKKIQIKVGSRKANKTYQKKYKKIFTKKNTGKKVKIVL